MGWKHYQTVDPSLPSPLPSPARQRAQGGQGTVWCPSTNSSLQISLFQIHRTFHIFLNFPDPLRKNISFPKCPKITQKFTQNRQTEVNVIRIEIWRCLKRDRDTGRKALLR